MKRLLSALFVLASSIMLTHAATTSDALKVPEKFDLAAIDAFLSAQVHQANRVGLSVAILKDGQLVLAKGYGKRSLADGRAVESNTLFAIGSVSKQFTCAAVLLLAEDGKLSVHDPVARFFPTLSRAKEITLLDLMNHVSGYPDYYPLDFLDRRMQQAVDPDELLRRYAGGKLDFEPGTRWSYSNTGYILLGRVVEKVSGESLGPFLTRRIFQPLGMTRTFYEPDPADGRLAQGYTTFALSAPEPAAPEARGWIGAAGGIYSTPSDLARWDLALMEGRILKPDSYALMTSRRQLPGGQLKDYGCGLSIKTQDGRLILSHNGAVSGFATWSGMIPSTKSAVIMTCNLDGGLGTLPNQIFALLQKAPASVPAVTGLPAEAKVQAVFADLQKGMVNRHDLADEFNHYLTENKILGASKRLKRFGAPKNAEVLSSHERGGMEVTTTRLTFKNGTLRVLMYRRPDGKIEQFFVQPD